MAARRLGLDGRLAFTGFCDDVEPVLESLDVLVHASILPEPFGQTVIEGMAAGLPVVASAAGGPTETIDDGEGRSGRGYDASRRIVTDAVGVTRKCHCTRARRRIAAHRGGRSLRPICSPMRAMSERER